jgi:phosphoribosylformylglycinamidine synthase
MPHRLEITSTVPDTRAQIRKKKFNNLEISGTIITVSIVDVYTIDKHFSPKNLGTIASILSNPVTQNAQFQPANPSQFTYAIEIGFHPGVTDNVAATAREMIEDALGLTFSEGENVYTSQTTFIDGKITAQDAATIAASLHNPLIQRATIKTYAQYKKDKGMGVHIPKVTLHTQSKVDTVNLNGSDEDLIAIGKKGIENTDGTRRGPLALDLAYMKAIRDYFKKEGRMPTDVELESIAQTWSEHCKHTIFADPIDEVKDGLYKTYIKAATNKIRAKKGKHDVCVSVFTDNSGAIEFDENYLVTDKVETHNSPSALDPFGGAITGIVGVNRDAIGFGLAAKPVINRYGYCFADPNDTSPLYKGPNKTPMAFLYSANQNT